MITGKYEGRPIYIHDYDGNSIADSVILETQPDMTITIKGTIDSSSEFVTALILGDDGVHEYQGKIRRVNSAYMTSELALFKGRVKESRSSQRYALRLPALVEHLLFGENSAPLPQPVEVLIINLSTSGALLQARPNCFSVQSVVELKLRIGDEIETLHTKVRWVKYINSTSAEYGCEFI